MDSEISAGERQEGVSRLARVVGRRVRMARVQSTWTQLKLAEKVGISVSFLSMIERGTRVPYLGTLQSLADALGLEVVDLFQDTPRAGGTAADEVLEPLAVFVRARKLTAGDVEHLVHVARAVFHEGHR